MAGATAELRVLHVIPSLGGGGSERSLCESLRQLPLHVHSEVVVFHRRRGDAVDEVRSMGVAVSEVTATGVAGRVRGVVEAIRRTRADVVHVSVAEAELPARLAAHRLRTPVVSVLASTTYDRVRLDDPAVRSWRLFAHQLVDAATARLCVSHFRAVSESAAADARRHLFVPADHITVIPRGRSDDAFLPVTAGERRAARAALDVPDGAFVVGSVSRREFSKALEVLVHAVAVLRDRGVPALFVHAGRPGNADPVIDAAIATCGVGEHVRLLGNRPDVVGAVLPAFDVFAFPSRYEGLPGALLEAAGRGLPIVASDIGPNRDLLADCISYVPRDQVVPLADALEELFRHPDRAEANARRCHEQVATRHRIAEIVEQEVALYERVAATGRDRNARWQCTPAGVGR